LGARRRGAADFGEPIEQCGGEIALRVDESREQIAVRRIQGGCPSAELRNRGADELGRGRGHRVKIRRVRFAAGSLLREHPQDEPRGVVQPAELRGPDARPVPAVDLLVGIDFGRERRDTRDASETLGKHGHHTAQQRFAERVVVLRGDAGVREDANPELLAVPMRLCRSHHAHQAIVPRDRNGSAAHAAPVAPDDRIGLL
jgi:hypothetical protein